MDFPPYCRSQLRSNTYRALVHLLSHISAYNASILEASTQPVNIPDNGSGRMDQENQEKEPKCSEVVDSDFLDPKDPICQKDIPEVQETIEGVEDKDMDFTSNKMVLDDIEHMMGIEDLSTQANGFDKEQKLMNEFEQVMKGTEDLICDSELIPLNLGLDKTRSDGGEVELMDYQSEVEEGEISGDLGIDGNLFDVASADALILRQMEVDEVQKPENVTGNMIYPSKIENQEKEKGYDSKSSLVNAFQDYNNNGQVEPRTSGKKGIVCGVEVAISKETIECQKEDKTKLDNASKKNKRGGNKGKKKKADRKKRAEKNKQLGVKRLQLQHVQKPKVVSHCRHYLNGRCHEGDKCQFSHDVVPLTKSKPCTHFARHSCMKGDDCPFDHQLSKYPCTNFVSKGSCYRGDACLFSHQVSTKEDIPTASNMCRPELSPLLSGNANSSTPLNNNHGSTPVQQNHLTNSAGIHSCTSVEHKVINTVQKQPTPPKGISFINLAKLSPSLSSLKQSTVTTKGSPVQIGTHEDQSSFHKTQNKVDIPKKLPAVTPKGINFLSFGKGSVCSFKSVNRENGIKLPQLFNFGLPEQEKSSLNKDDYNKASDTTKQNAPQTDIFLTEILGKNQSVAEEMKLKLPEKTSVDFFMRDHSHSKSVQEGKKSSDNSQSSKGQKALLSTLAFAAEHESSIKMKYPTGGLPMSSEDSERMFC
ncbi:Zinc finger CCCH domain-containing protein 65 [Glycine max]|uniref:Zinc finger CCCH domain-containing protein 65 isoform A n=1 Tax=Glycine soja TaxID=3848 RepID=A0A445HAF8_GLYSO|nr:zinc finger CCCH domain-containing protein 65-like [Glycine soja]KAH1214598.1 Zinc finger CCCH domain-containing protein 65 [Glycine max]KAH1214600.1 Zinc finger CCCH domain-containing protein 65 [Glycine max]RZB70100.1 Zinc finger CCCH domain-containing protein 65 isoform A [Glycine soja]RZB70101.1 Zinc finger CCCH domain-containing protein 65 isoform B [Glycine soja]